MEIAKTLQIRCLLYQEIKKIILLKKHFFVIQKIVVMHTIYLRKWTKNGVAKDEISRCKERKYPISSSSATPFLVALSSVNCAQTSDSDVLEN